MFMKRTFLKVISRKVTYMPIQGAFLEKIKKESNFTDDSGSHMYIDLQITLSTWFDFYGIYYAAG